MTILTTEYGCEGKESMLVRLLLRHLSDAAHQLQPTGGCLLLPELAPCSLWQHTAEHYHLHTQ